MPFETWKVLPVFVVVPPTVLHKYLFGNIFSKIIQVDSLLAWLRWWFRLIWAIWPSEGHLSAQRLLHVNQGGWVLSNTWIPRMLSRPSIRWMFRLFMGGS